MDSALSCLMTTAEVERWVIGVIGVIGVGVVVGVVGYMVNA
jgi:hypothetical protein